MSLSDANASLRQQLQDIIRTAQAAIDPFECLRPRLAELDYTKRYLVVGAGKAAAKMALACETALENVTGLVIVPDGHGLTAKRIEIVEASHPVPDERGLKATRRIMDLCAPASADEIIMLLSGGASALLVQPATGVSLNDKRRVTRALLASGASIDEFNTVRKHLSQVKGGKLLALAKAPVRTYAISDVPGDDPQIIGSAPTVPDISTAKDAREILERHGIEAPPSVVAALNAKADRLPLPDTSPYELIAGPANAVRAAAQTAEALGYSVSSFDYLKGDASEVARAHVALARKQMAKGVKAAIISGGELSVSLGDVRAIGGRCREYLLAVAAFAGDTPWLSGAAWDTDGIDGSGADAGAFIFFDTVARAAKHGWNMEEALHSHRSGEVFAALGDAITLGPTLTNVGDMRVILINP